MKIDNLGVPPFWETSIYQIWFIVQSRSMVENPRGWQVAAAPQLERMSHQVLFQARLQWYGLNWVCHKIRMTYDDLLVKKKTTCSHSATWFLIHTIPIWEGGMLSCFGKISPGIISIVVVPANMQAAKMRGVSFDLFHNTGCIFTLCTQDSSARTSKHKQLTYTELDIPNVLGLLNDNTDNRYLILALSLRLQGICVECWTKMSTGHFGSSITQVCHLDRFWKRLRLCISFRPFFEHVGFVGRRVGDDLQCSDQGSGRSSRPPYATSGKGSVSWTPSQNDWLARHHQQTVHAGDPWRDNDTGWCDGDWRRTSGGPNVDGGYSSSWHWHEGRCERRLPGSWTGAAGPEGGRCRIRAPRGSTSDPPASSLAIGSREPCIWQTCCFPGLFSQCAKLFGQHVAVMHGNGASGLVFSVHAPPVVWGSCAEDPGNIHADESTMSTRSHLDHECADGQVHSGPRISWPQSPTTGPTALHPHVQLLYVRLARAGHFLFPAPEECHLFHIRRPTLWMMWCGVVLGPGGWQAYLGAVLHAVQWRAPLAPQARLDWLGSSPTPLMPRRWHNLLGLLHPWTRWPWRMQSHWRSGWACEKRSWNRLWMRTPRKRPPWSKSRKRTWRRSDPRDSKSSIRKRPRPWTFSAKRSSTPILSTRRRKWTRRPSVRKPRWGKARWPSTAWMRSEDAKKLAMLTWAMKYHKQGSRECMRVVGARPETDPPDLALKIKLNLDQLQALERRTHVDTLIEDPMDPVLFTQQEVRAMFRHVLPSSYSLPVRYLQGMFIPSNSLPVRCLQGMFTHVLLWSNSLPVRYSQGMFKPVLSWTNLLPVRYL